MAVLTTSRAKTIQSDSKAATAKTGEKMKLSYGGGVHPLPVYKIPIKHLIYNIRNGRFRAELLAIQGLNLMKLSSLMQHMCSIEKMGHGIII